MVCLKIIRRHWICSIFVFSLFSFFSVFGLSQNSYATSYDCSVTYSGLAEYSLNDICTGANFSDVLSSPIFLYDLSISASGMYNSSNPVRFQFTTVSSSPLFQYFEYTPCTSSNSSPCSYHNSSIVFVSPMVSSFYYLFNFRFSQSLSVNLDPITFKISDDISDFSGDCPVCEVCPVIPENPYDNKLDNITKAIYCCGAILIMLYFFFCIYKIIVKDGGSR